MIVLDASVWVSAVRRQDVNHPVSLRWSTAWLTRGDRISVPALFLAEIAGAVSRPARDPALGRLAVADVTGDPGFTVVPVDQLLAETAGYHASDLFLRGSDAVYVALAERLGVPLITWDQEQLTRAATLIDVRTPSI